MNRCEEWPRRPLPVAHSPLPLGPLLSSTACPSQRAFHLSLSSTHQLPAPPAPRWTVSCISQIYMAKIVADSVSERDGNPRPGICEFAYEWHINR